MSSANKPWGKLAASGAASVALYTLLFANEKQVMEAFTRVDSWYPLLPVVTAFAFSFAHGAFTGYFWDALGIKPRLKTSEQNKVEERSDEALE